MAAITPYAVQLLAPSGEAGRTLRHALRHAGVPDTQLDEMTLMAAQQLRAAGVPMHEIRENLDAVASGAGRD